MTTILKQRFTINLLFQRHQLPVLTCNSYHNLPLSYESNDPAPHFFSSSIQKILKYLTHPAQEKVFKKKTSVLEGKLSDPEYKFLTNEQLHEEILKAKKRAECLLQMPPVVKVYEHVEKIISKDPGITGFDTTRYVFIDITYGLRAIDKRVFHRDPDGVLKYADIETKKRLVQTFFPMKGRSLREPSMFTDETLFNGLLEKNEYEFILDRACVQYDPNEYKYQCINSKVYQHCNSTMNYDILRSTRHFGPMVFYFAWHNFIDGLMIDTLQNGQIREATTLINLQRIIHQSLTQNDDTIDLIDDIIASRDFLLKEDPEYLTDADTELDEQCFLCVDNYIQNHSLKKGQLELAYRALRTAYNNRIEHQKGINIAHGHA